MTNAKDPEKENRSSNLSRRTKDGAKAEAPPEEKKEEKDDKYQKNGLDLQWSAMSAMFQPPQSMSELRRRALTMVDLMSERQMSGPLRFHRILAAICCFFFYSHFIVPLAWQWGTSKYHKDVENGLRQPLAGGPAADVSPAMAFLVTVVYLCVVFFGVRIMEGRPPAQKRVFEYVTVYNCTQVLLNLWLVLALLREAWKQGYLSHPWGNELQVGAQHDLGRLIWFQYHARQLDFMDTVFMVLRKKFQRISFLHIYLRLLNMWAWFFACKYGCGGDTYFAALINSACQVIVYLYYTVSLLKGRRAQKEDAVISLKRSLVIEVQVAQFVICLCHAVYVLYCGHMPRGLALLNIFVMWCGLVMYIDFDGTQPRLGPRDKGVEHAGYGQGRITFCFDSSGWFCVYHFGAAVWLWENLLPEGLTPEKAATDAYPKELAFSGSSGGALVGAALAMGLDPRTIFETIMSGLEECKQLPFGPFQILPQAERALARHVPQNAGKTMSGRCRVLLTRVRLQPPFLTGEVVDQFADKRDTEYTLRASSHVPGLYLRPYKLDTGYYFDGLMWASLFVPWQSAADSSHVIKVSAVSRPLTDVRAPLMPIWWALIPPSVDAVRGLFWTGYRDMAMYFAEPPGDPLEGCKRRKPERSQSSDDEGHANGHINGNGSGYSSDSDPLVSSRMAKYLAVRKLVKKSAKPFPTKDPVTGQDVQELLNALNDSIEFNVKVVGCALMVPILALLFLGGF
eukprot:TRINITY_DN3402_c0_g1_i1.p1 TRINITY_DN3402_c0_g1~~TRINITY_DN3402_c0_g1_i1.p1  ORF type:complete len:737 (-),score=139.56 TRINITY_DN3402_c0_g1_i1:334-2544(-)